MKKQIAIVDICWTLFYSNTTFDFVDYVVRSKSYRCWHCFSRLWLVRKLNSFIYKIFHVDFLRKITLRYLAGFSHDELLKFAEKFYIDFLEKRKIFETWQQLNDFDEIVLASGTLDVVAQIVAEKLGATNFYSSILEYKNGICTGRLQLDFLQSKSKLLSQCQEKSFVFITDNLSDYQLVEKASMAIILVYDNEARWRKLLKNQDNVEYVYLNNGRRY